MEFIDILHSGKVATIVLSRGKVNALNEQLVEELSDTFDLLEKDHATSSVILTGSGKFFSFGFDIPEFYDYSIQQFNVYLTKFTALYKKMFLFPKPLIAAINGHAVAGGCMLATACDYRVMTGGKPRISLNEVSFGATVFAGGVAMLKCCVGHRNAERVLLTGAMYSAGEALQLGLVDLVTDEDDLTRAAHTVAEEYACNAGPAFADAKGLLRNPVAEDFSAREKDSIAAFLEIWYSDDTRKKLRNIKIKK